MTKATFAGQVKGFRGCTVPFDKSSHQKIIKVSPGNSALRLSPGALPEHILLVY